MFRVVGRDAQGRVRELSLCAPSEEEARALAQAEGLVTIERVSPPPPPRPSRLPKLGGFAAGVLGCLGCLTTAVLGAVIGWFVGDALEPPSNFLRVGWLVGSAVGAGVGLILGVVILVACLKHLWRRG